MTPQQLQAMKMALEALKNNKLTHLYCEDTWYSCPKHEDGCANEAEGDECNCGADDVNAQFDQAIIALEEALAQPEQEPMISKWVLREVYFDEDGEPISHRSPPQRKPLSASEIVTMYAERPTSDNDMIEFARAIEAAHGIKGEA